MFFVCVRARARCRRRRRRGRWGKLQGRGGRGRPGAWERQVHCPSWVDWPLKVKSHSRYVRPRCLGFSELIG